MDACSNEEEIMDLPSQITRDQDLVIRANISTRIGSGDLGRVYKAHGVDTG